MTKRFGFVVALIAMLLVPAAAAQARDRDHDNLPDKWERKHHISTKSKSAAKDPDRDGVDNGNEYREGTNPRKRDSDSDGISDAREDRDRDGLRNGAEDQTGNDPVDRDTDDDGIKDGNEQAGTVTSFTGGVLTIDLANGSSVTGKVTAATEIKCESEDNEEGDHRNRGRGHSARNGDDDGPNHDVNDDHGNDDGDSNDHDDGEAGDGRACTTADLVAGARVHEAELRTTADGLVFEEIELLK
jgi:hypothetical protein